MFSKFSKRIGIDLGTSYVRLVSEDGKEPVIERNLLIIDPSTEDIFYLGNSAYEIYGKENPELKVIKPVKNGILQDNVFEKFVITDHIKKMVGRNRLFKPNFIVSTPLKLRESDKNSIFRLLEELGSGNKSQLIPEIILSAVGLSLPINKSTGIAIVNLGAGTTEIAVLSLGGVIVGESMQYGGEDLDNLIIESFRLSNIEIGKKTAELLKIKFGSAETVNNTATEEVKGKDIITGKMLNFIFKKDLIRVAILPGLEKIAESIKQVLEKLPPELASDIIDNGLIITGGLSNLNNLNFYLSNYLNIPVYRLENPHNSCIKGINYIINNSYILDQNYYTK